MLKFIKLLPLLIIPTLTLSCKKKSEKKNVPKVIKVLKWKLYQSKDGEFSVLYSGKKTESHRKTKLPGTKKRIEVKNVYFAVNKDAFTVQYFHRQHQIDPKKELESRISSLVKKMRGKILLNKDIKGMKYPGKELHMKSANGIKLIRMFITKEKVFLAIANLKPNGENKENGIKFIHSLKIK
jgi:hypothetical protein